MKKQLYYIALTIAVILLLGANLFVFLSRKASETHQEPRFEVDASQVLRVEEQYISRESRLSESPQVNPDHLYLYTDPEGIAQLCNTFSNLFVREYPYQKLNAEQQQNAQDNTHITRYTFFLRNGSTKTIYTGAQQSIRFDHHWCFATLGESEGYYPFFPRLNRIQNEYAEHITSKSSAP